MKAETKYKGSIKLSAIGDALGWITEFEKTPQSLKSKFGTERIDKFYAWEKVVGGRFYGYIDMIKAGSYSDDTQLLLSVARSIKRDGLLDHEYFAKIELANWLEYARGGGRTVKTAADKISRKSIKWFNNFYNFKVNKDSFDYKQSGANGAAMRVLPIALANLGNIEKIKEDIFCNSIITHGHPRAILGAMLYGYAINQIILYRPEDFTWENYLTQIGQDLPKKFGLPFLNRKEINQWLQEWNRSSKSRFEDVFEETLYEAQNQLRLIYQSLKQNLSVKETLHKLGCFDPSTKGSGIVTVIAGIYLTAKFHKNPLEAILESVNALGSDTDSIAAFSGGLIGALHGQNIIPDKWKNVQDFNYLDKIAERLLAISEDRLEEFEQTIIAKHFKLLNKPQSDNFSLEEEIQFIPLGLGKITSISRQSTLTKGKYNLIIEADFYNGQSIVVSKLFNDPSYQPQIRNYSTGNENLIALAKDKLKPKTFFKFCEYLENRKNVKNIDYSMIELILKNDN